MQVSPHDCTGCELCVHVCPDSALKPEPIGAVLTPEAARWDFMKTIPNRGDLFDKNTIRGSQFQQVGGLGWVQRGLGQPCAKGRKEPDRGQINVRVAECRGGRM